MESAERDGAAAAQSGDAPAAGPARGGPVDEAVAAPVLQALANLSAEREKAQAAVHSYKGYEDSRHFPPWLDRLRLLTCAEYVPDAREEAEHG